MSQEAPAQQGEDEDPFRRANSIRKSRAKTFFTNEGALFTLASVLVYHHFLGRVTKICFRLRDHDREDAEEPMPEGPPPKKRFLFKGSQAFQPVEPRKCKQLDIYESSKDCVDIFWRILTSTEAFDKTVFGLLPFFWPSNWSKEDLYIRVASDTLKTISGLKWRVMARKQLPPVSLLQLAEDDVPEEALQKGTDSFMALQPCCMDPWWALPVKQDISSQQGLQEQAARLRNHARIFRRTSRVVSAREENGHASQRIIAGGFRAKPVMFERQAAEMTLMASLSNHQDATKSTLQGASDAVKTSAKISRVRKIVHKRPRQFGSSMFYFISSQLRNGAAASTAQLRTQWKNLNPAEKETWQRKHRVAVASKRFAKAYAEQKSKEAADRKLTRSPWNLGSGQYPLKAELLKHFLKEFQTKASGLQKVSSFQSPEGMDFKRKLDLGAKYHSMQAAEVSARESLGHFVCDANAFDGTWGKVASTARPKKTCSQLHWGVCRTADANLMSDIMALVEALPKGDASVFMLELSGQPAHRRVMAFFRLVIGLVSDRVWGESDRSLQSRPILPIDVGISISISIGSDTVTLIIPEHRFKVFSV